MQSQVMVPENQGEPALALVPMRAMASPASPKMPSPHSAPSSPSPLAHLRLRQFPAEAEDAPIYASSEKGKEKEPELSDLVAHDGDIATTPLRSVAHSLSRTVTLAAARYDWNLPVDEDDNGSVSFPPTKNDLPGLNDSLPEEDISFHVDAHAFSPPSPNVLPAWELAMQRMDMGEIIQPTIQRKLAWSPASRDRSQLAQQLPTECVGVGTGSHKQKRIVADKSTFASPRKGQFRRPLGNVSNVALFAQPVGPRQATPMKNAPR